jgi:hypothetical protein
MQCPKGIANLRAGYSQLTLLGPGEVKVDLINFDLKWQENLVSTSFKKNTHSCKNFMRIFLNFSHNLKKLCFDVHFNVYLSEARLRHLPANPSLCLVLPQLQNTQRWEKSCWKVVRSPAWHQSGFQSVSSPRPCTVQGWWVLSRACPLALSKCTVGSTPIKASSRNQQTLQSGDASYTLPPSSVSRY